MRNLLLASLLLAALAACRMKNDPKVDPASVTCAAVGSGCSDHGDCCSYACLTGACIANVVPGGVCRTSDDCDLSMTCVSGHCQPGATCRPNVRNPSDPTTSPGDVCSYNNQCCTGNCVGENTSTYPPVDGRCYAETAPTVELGGPFTVPYFATTTLRAAVTDPDPEQTFYYAWDAVTVPTGATLAGWTSSLITTDKNGSVPVFLSAKGTYVIRVRVADGPSTQRQRFTATDTVVLVAENYAPVVDADPTHLPTTALRNTDVQLVGAVSDPNGTATPVSCAWYAKPPGQAELATPIASWTNCPASPTTVFRSPITGPQGAWEFRLVASDGELSTSAYRTITFVNAAPVALACAYECVTPPAGATAGIRAGNVGALGAARTQIPLHGSATDANADQTTTGFTFEWTLDTPAESSSLIAGAPLGSGNGPTGPGLPFAGMLEPDVAGTYVVRLHVEDGWGATAEATVPVVVGPYLRPLQPLDGTTQLPTGLIIDAAYHHGASAADDRLVFATETPTGATYRLWALDPASLPTSATPYVEFTGRPAAIAVKPDGNDATVATTSNWFTVSLSGTLTLGTVNPFGPGWSGTTTDILYASRKYAVSSTGAVHELGPSASSNTSAQACTQTACNVTGTRGTSGGSYVWLVSGGELRRYLGKANGNLEPDLAFASGLTGTSDVWASADDGGGRDVFAATGTVFDGALLTAADALPSAARHVDSVAPGGVRSGVMVSSDGSRVIDLNASWDDTGRTIVLPRVGHLGTGYPLEAVYAFVRSDGAARYLVLRSKGTVAGSARWYLLKD